MFTQITKRAFCVFFVLTAIALNAHSQVTWSAAYPLYNFYTSEAYRIVTRYTKEPFDAYISGELVFMIYRSTLYTVETWNGVNLATLASTDSDLPSVAREHLNQKFDAAMAAEGVAYYQQVTNPTAIYNCHAYAIGETAYWIDNSDIHFYYLKYKTQLPNSLNASICAHGSSWFTVDHSSKIAMMPQTIPQGCEGAGTTLIVEVYEGKFGISGRYLSQGRMPDDYYSCDLDDRVYLQ